MASRRANESSARALDAHAADGRRTRPENREQKARLLARLLLFFGVWGTLAPYVGPDVLVRQIVEVVDHVVPGVVVLGVALLSLHRRRIELIPAGLAVLAGLWMTTTHVPLVGQAARGETSWDGALWMFVPSACVFVIAVWAVAVAWIDEGSGRP